MSVCESPCSGRKYKYESYTRKAEFVLAIEDRCCLSIDLLAHTQESKPRQDFLSKSLEMMFSDHGVACLTVVRLRSEFDIRGVLNQGEAIDLVPQLAR